MKPIATLIIKYLKGQLEGNNLSPDATEGVEVAVQCLENAYSVTAEDIENCNQNLDELYQASLNAPQHGRVVTEEQKAQAESLKALGNQLMKDNKHGEAVGRYSSGQQLADRLQSQMEGPQQGAASTSQPVAQPASSSASSSGSSAPPPRRNRPRGPVLSAEERYDSVGPGGEAPSAMAYAAMRNREESEGEDSADQ